MTSGVVAESSILEIIFFTDAIGTLARDLCVTQVEVSVEQACGGAGEAEARGAPTGCGKGEVGGACWGGSRKKTAGQLAGGGTPGHVGKSAQKASTWDDAVGVIGIRIGVVGVHHDLVLQSHRRGLPVKLHCAPAHACPSAAQGAKPTVELGLVDESFHSHALPAAFADLHGVLEQFASGGVVVGFEC